MTHQRPAPKLTDSTNTYQRPFAGARPEISSVAGLFGVGSFVLGVVMALATIITLFVEPLSALVPLGVTALLAGVFAICYQVDTRLNPIMTEALGDALDGTTRSYANLKNLARELEKPDLRAAADAIAKDIRTTIAAEEELRRSAGSRLSQEVNQARYEQVLEEAVGLAADLRSLEREAEQLITARARALRASTEAPRPAPGSRSRTQDVLAEMGETRKAYDQLTG